MQKVKCEQGTDKWKALKAGVASASNFDRLVTASLKPSSQANDYLYELMGEWVTGEKKDLPNLYWVERGIEIEPQARSAFEFATDSDIEQVGFIFKDRTKLVGCSPDGLVGSKGVEIKCPMPIIHVSYVLQGICPKKYMPQVQGSMWITGLHQWDFMSYHPDYKSLIVPVDRDSEWMYAFDKILPPFLKRLKEMRKDPTVIEMRDKRLAE